MNEDLIIELAQERDDLREAVHRQAKEIVALQAENRSLRIDLQIAKAEAKAVHDHFACDYPSPAVLDAIRTAQMHAREDTYRLRRMRTIRHARPTRGTPSETPHEASRAAVA